jgi:hypothetical protein
MANLRVGAAFYPLALFTKDFLANIGVAGHYEHSLGGKTQAGADPNTGVDSGDLDTSLSAYDIGLRVRLPISQHELGFSAAYGQQQFDIDDGVTDPDPVAGETTQLVPDVNYKFIRLGADFTYAFKSYFFKGDVGLRVVNSAGDQPGEIQADTWFPNSDVGGMDLALTAGYNVSERFTITLGMDFRNYYYSMNSTFADYGLGLPPGSSDNPSGDRNPVAGGANDMYFSGMLAAKYSMR